MHLFPVPHLFRTGSSAEFLLHWYLYDFCALLLVAALAAAFITTVVLLARRNWKSIPQHIFEILIAFVSVLVLPAY